MEINNTYDKYGGFFYFKIISILIIQNYELRYVILLDTLPLIIELEFINCFFYCFMNILSINKKKIKTFFYFYSSKPI